MGNCEKFRRKGEKRGRGHDIWSIMSITSRTTLETLDTLRSRARQRTRQVLLAEHVHRDWAVNTSKEPLLSHR